MTTLSSPGYEHLAAVLEAAFKQASEGKGAERHARGNAFHEQHMQTISTLLNSDRGMAFQAIKKLTEGLDFEEIDRRERELLGVIVYVAGIIVWHREGPEAAMKILPPVGQSWGQNLDPTKGGTKVTES